jgi:hypothetical protein
MVRPKKPETATVIGSGPNGLSAAIEQGAFDVGLS